MFKSYCHPKERLILQVKSWCSLKPYISIKPTYPAFWVLVRVIFLCQPEVGFSDLAFIMPETEKEKKS